MQTFKSGSARTLDPTNKNYAPELSTFGTIIEVNRSEVQWKSLSLGKLPSWSQLIPAPGKYEVSGRDLRLWTLCTNCRGSRFWGHRTSDHVFTLTELWKSYQNKKGLLHSLFRQQSLDKTDFLLVRVGYFSGKVRGKLNCRNPPSKPATSIKLIARLP